MKTMEISTTPWALWPGTGSERVSRV